MHEGLQYRETYQLKPTATGTEVRYTLGPSYDAEGGRHETADAETAAFLEGFWPQAFDELEVLIRTAD